MKNGINTILLNLIACVSLVYSFETSADSSNPFNEFLNPVKGIDLYSGNVIHSQNLFTLSGRNGLDIDVTLYYSSNVYNNVRSRNDINPTSWVGLGWRLGYGSIVSYHKNTIFMYDDEYEYISPTSEKERMYQKYDATPDIYGDDAFYIKSNPFLKFRRIIDYDADIDDSIVTGWEVTTTSGKKYKYGDLEEYGSGDNRNATWKTFCWYGERDFSPNYDPTGTSHHYRYGYVGNGFSGDANNLKEYGYRWDLSQIEDLFGNRIRFYYTQENEGVSAKIGPVWKSHIQYTKASYINEIINPQGQKVKFFTGDKYESEYLDLQTFYEEGDTGDAFMELYETKFLDSIEVYNINGSIMKKVDLSYDTGSVPVDSISHYTKRMLREIRYIKVPLEGESIPQREDAENVYDVRFTYNVSDDSTRYESTEYHYGALDTLKSSSGGLTAFHYERKELPEDSCKKIMFLEATAKSDNEYGIFGFAGPSVPRNNVTSTSGKTREGIEYIVYCVDKWNKHLSCILWNGKKWENAIVHAGGSDYVMKDWAGLGETRLNTIAGRDFFIAQRAESSSDTVNFNYLRVFDWDAENKKWVRGFYITDGTGGCGHFDNTLAFCGSHYFVVAFSFADNGPPEYIRVYYRLNGQWQASIPVKVTSSANGAKIKKIVGTDDYFIVLIDDDIGDNVIRPKYVKVFNYNCGEGDLGEHWACTFDHKFIGDSGVDVAAGRNFFMVANKESFSQTHINQEVSIYHWDGFKWQRTFFKSYYDGSPVRDEVTGENVERAFIKCGENFAVIGYNQQPRGATYHRFYPAYVDVFTWTGKMTGNATEGFTWEDKLEITRRRIDGLDRGINISIGGNSIVATVGTVDYNGCENPEIIDVYKWEYEQETGGQWKWRWRNEEYTGVGMGGLIHTVPGNKYFVALSGTDALTSIVRGYSWDGASFDINYQNTEELAGTKSLNASNYGDIVSANYSSNSQQGAEHRVFIFKRHNDDLANPLFSYIVTQKTVKDGINPAGLTTQFTFDTVNMNFDTERNSCKNEKVAVLVEGNKWGKTVSYFHNEFFSENLDNYRLNGYNYRDDIFRYTNGTFQLISQNIDTFSVYKDPAWPEDIHSFRRIKSETMTDMLTKKTTFDFSGDTCEYPDRNGLPRIVRNYNSRDKIRTGFTVYAYELGVYGNDFLTRNMLTQPAMNLVLEESSQSMLSFCPYNTWYTGGIGRNFIRTAEVVTWTNDNNTENIWAPYELYRWKIDYDSTGRPVDSLKNFDFENPPLNLDNNWVRELTFTNYNKFGQLTEFLKPNSKEPDGITPYSIIYRNDLGNVIANVVNAGYNECAFFTGDYYMKDGQYNTSFDELNGWTKGFGGSCELSDEPHFGLRTVYVDNSYGPTKKFDFGNLSRNKDYVFSAWVKPDGNTGPVTLGVLAWRADDKIDFSITFTVLKPDKWQLLTNQFSLESVPRDYQKLEIWVGNQYVGSPPPSRFFVDDIRFYPEDALASATYYHPQWNQEIVTVDANNNPGKRKVYDGLRRPIEWYKMRHNESNILVRKKEYHHRGFDE